MFKKVLITASGTGSRLGELTKHFNKSLIRIGKKPAISHILESYPTDSDFVITVGYHSDYVKQYINMAHPELKIKFADVDCFDGPGSGLLYSLTKAESYVQEPFIFHVCDSILEKNDNYLLSGNFIVTGQTELDTKNYRCYNDKTKIIEEKGIITHSPYVGVAGITNYQRFWDLTKELVNTPDSSDVHVINQMIMEWYTFNVISTKWYDIGTLETLENTRQNHSDKFHILDKVDESIYIFNDFVIKFFANKKVCKSRIDRFAVLDGMVPELLASSDNFYKYRYAVGTEFSKVATSESIIKMLDVCKDRLWTKTDKDIFKNCLSFYITKTLDRIKAFREKYNIADSETVINGKQLPSLDMIMDRLILESAKICTSASTGFHGDFILENMIETNDSVVLIDWRQDFDGDIINGDMYYDLAKFNHNLTVDHDLIYQNKYDVSINENNVEVSIEPKHEELKITYKKWILENCFDEKKIDILTAIIWLNMSALHDEKFSKFLYYYGYLKLYEAL